MNGEPSPEVLEQLRLSRAIKEAVAPLGLEWLGTVTNSDEPGVITVRLKKV